MRGLSAVVAAVLALGVAACEHADPLVDGGEENGLEPTLESIQENIFNTTCAVSGCHAASSASAGLDLSSANARANLVGVESTGVPSLFRVDPGNADDSYLVLKLEGDDRIAGNRMPLGRPPLPPSQIDVIREWIDGGAQ